MVLGWWWCWGGGGGGGVGVAVLGGGGGGGNNMQNLHNLLFLLIRLSSTYREKIRYRTAEEAEYYP